VEKYKRGKAKKVDKTWMPFSPRLVDESKYHKYKDMIIMLGLDVQVMKPSYDSEMETKICTGLSDSKIADLLGLEAWEVNKIRTVRETEVTERIMDKIYEDSLDFESIGPSAQDALKFYKSFLVKKSR
jgi:hypothetical protein